MDRQTENIELFETFEVEQISAQVREGDSSNFCYWCYYFGPSA